MPGTTPSLALPYPLPTDQVSQGSADIRALAEDVERKLGSIVGATLPAAPTAGQRALLAGPADWVCWELVWDNGFWRFLGGADFYAIDVNRISAGGAWASAGPTIHLPYVGLYDFLYGARWDSGGAGAQAGFVTVAGPGVAADDYHAQITQTGHSYGGWTAFDGSGLFGVRVNWTTIGGDFGLWYRNNSGGAPAYASNRRIWARPIYLTQTPATGLSDDELLAAIERENAQLREAGLLADPPAEARPV